MSREASTSVSGHENTDNNRQILAEIRALAEFKPLKTKQRRFILAYAGSGKITHAASLSGIPWITHYSWLERVPEYKQAFDKAREIFGDYAEGEVFDRAFFGEQRTIVKGKGNERVVETYMHKSDILAMFALKGLKPQYRDNFSINQFAGPVQLNVKFGDSVVDPLAKPVNNALTNQGNEGE